MKKFNISILYVCILLGFFVFVVYMGATHPEGSSTSTTATKYIYSQPSIPTFTYKPFDYGTFDPNPIIVKGTYVITYSARLARNNSVGNQWGRGIKYNGEYIEPGTPIEILGNKIMIVAAATEYDDCNDYGQTYVSFDSLGVGEKCTQEVSVVVRENRGRYSGNTAEWIFEITLERIK